MAIIALRAWYLPEYEPIAALEQRPYDLRLAKNSLLKSALRADFLDEVQVVRQSMWFQRYMAGEQVEFYIEGSGTYTIANIDLTSHEIYFLKQDSHCLLDPVIFFSQQVQQPELSHNIYECLEQVLANPKWRIPLTIEPSPRPQNLPIKLKSAVMPRLRKSLLFVADISPIAYIQDEPIFSPQVCVELGYALQVKRTDQILLLQLAPAVYCPFDLPFNNCVSAPDPQKLMQILPEVLGDRLQRFKL
ncbi:MAG: hypothetical protein ACK4QL_06180 [Pseudanabaenaceae cyanobacterium]